MFFISNPSLRKFETFMQEVPNFPPKGMKVDMDKLEDEILMFEVENVIVNLKQHKGKERIMKFRNDQHRSTLGGEVFIPLGSSLAEEIYPNEYGYFNDSTNEVLCRLESKQCENTKVSVETKNILMIIQGNEKTSSDLLMEAKNELMHNMNKFFNFNLKEMFEFL